MPTYTQTLLHNIDFHENIAIQALIIEEKKCFQKKQYNNPREKANALYDLALSYNETLAIFLYDCGESEKAAQAAQKAIEIASLALSLYTKKADKDATQKQIIAYQKNALFFENSISDNESDAESTEIFSDDNQVLTMADGAHQDNVSNSPIRLPVKNDFFTVEDPLQDFVDACRKSGVFKYLFDKNKPAYKRRYHDTFFQSEDEPLEKKCVSNPNYLNDISSSSNSTLNI